MNLGYRITNHIISTEKCCMLLTQDCYPQTQTQTLKPQRARVLRKKGLICVQPSPGNYVNNELVLEFFLNTLDSLNMW